MLFERFKLKRKLNKFEEWCDSKNLKNKHPHYYKFFSKFADTNELSSIINTFEILENFKSKLKYLDVNPLSYNSLWDLTKDIEYIDYVIRMIKPSPYNDVFNEQDLEGQKKLIKLVKESGLDLYPGEIKKISRFCKKNGLKFTNTNPSRKEKLLKSVASDKKVDLIYNQDNIVIIQIFDTDSSKKYGAKPWCIKDKSHWKEYVGKKSQYFIYNFNYHHDYDWYLLGMTLKERSCNHCKCVSKLKVRWVFDQENNEVWNGVTKFNKSNYKYNYDNSWVYDAFKIIKKVKQKNNLLNKVIIKSG